MAIKECFEKNKGFWFVWNSFGVALVIMAVLFTIAPYLEEPDPLKPRVMDYATTIQLVGAQDVHSLLASGNSKPTLLIIYASWCRACREKMPEIIELIQEGRLSHLNLVFLSKDTGVMKLSKYLVRSGFYEHITPYLIKKDENTLLKNMLRSRGSVFKGGIPFTELYTPNGQALTFIPHYASKDALIAATKSE